MDNRQVATLAAILVAALIGLVVVVNLTGDDEPPTSTTTSSTSSTTTPTTADTSPSTTVPADLGDRVLAQLAARTADSTERARSLAAPGSPAEAYFLHQVAALSIVGDQPVARLEGSEPWRVCDQVDGGARCRTFDALTTDADGRLFSFEIDGRSIEGRLVVDGYTVSDGGVTVSLVSAYRTIPDDSMVVIVEIENGRSDGIIANGFAAVYSDPTLGDFEVASSVGLDAIAGGGSARMLFVFDSGDIAGDLVLPFTSADFTESFQITLTAATP